MDNLVDWLMEWKEMLMEGFCVVKNEYGLVDRMENLI